MEKMATHVDNDHAAELAAVQPYWLVARGQAPGLRAGDAEALASGCAPPSYLAITQQFYARYGVRARWMTYGGIALLGAAAAMGGVALVRHSGEWLGGVLFGGLFGLLGLFLGIVWRRAARQAKQGDDAWDVRAVSAMIQRKWWRRGGRSAGVGYLQLEQLVLGVPSTQLWRALREGVRYRLWYFPLSFDRDGEVLWVELADNAAR